MYVVFALKIILLDREDRTRTEIGTLLYFAIQNIINSNQWTSSFLAFAVPNKIQTLFYSVLLSSSFSFFFGGRFHYVTQADLASNSYLNLPSAELHNQAWLVFFFFGPHAC
jgi:hypothetical protein